MSLFDGLFNGANISDDTRGTTATALQALGLGLLSGNRDQPIGPAFGQMLAASQKGTSRSALKALLVQAGYSDAEAERLASSEGVAKLAIQQKQQERILSDGGGSPPPLLGGDVGGAPAAPRMSPAAPGGPAAGASLNGDAATSFLNTLIGKESGGNATAKNPNSSATGLTQFTSGTWDQMMRQHPELGLTPDGRTDPEQAKRAALAYARDNAAELGKSGHEATPGNLYLGHFLGGGGATRFLNGLRNNPNAPAASYADPGAVAANRSVFYNPDGSAKSAQVFYNERTSRFGGGAPVQTADAGAAAQAQPTATDAPSPGLPRLAGQPAPAALGVENNILNSPMRGVADSGPADMPAPGSHEAGFVIPPAAKEAVERRVGTPPTPVNESVGPTTQRAMALRNYDYWAKRLRMSGTLGDAGKGLAEEAKQRMELAAKFLAPTDTERLADAAGLTGEDRTQAIAGSIGGNAPTSMQKEYRQYVQQEVAAGRRPLSLLDYDLKIRGASRPEQNTTIKNVVNPIAKGLGDQLLEQRKEAAAAAQSIQPIHQARQLLDEGVFTGPLAEQKLALGRVGALIGLQNPKVESTEAFASAIGNQVLANIKALGANPSNTDREFIEKVAGGKITLTEPSLRRILDINENAARQKIVLYNSQVDPMVATADDELKPLAGVLRVREPGGYQRAERSAPSAAPGSTSPAPAAGPREGATATNPQTGERVILRGGKWVPLTGGVL